jgi:hypothetical protein
MNSDNFWPRKAAARFSMRVRLDRDHGFQSIVIINSGAS